MAMRVLALGVISLLSGCASLGLYKGLAMATCNGPVTAPQFRTGGCMTGAEYDAARKKELNSGR